MKAQAPNLQGLVVPSVAMLDRPDQYNVVVFRDAIDLDTCFGTPVHIEDIVIAASGA